MASEDIRLTLAEESRAASQTAEPPAAAPGREARQATASPSDGNVSSDAGGGSVSSDLATTAAPRSPAGAAEDAISDTVRPTTQEDAGQTSTGTGAAPDGIAEASSTGVGHDPTSAEGEHAGSAAAGDQPDGSRGDPSQKRLLRVGLPRMTSSRDVCATSFFALGGRIGLILCRVSLGRG
jgi:hypothetical protein